MEVIARSSISFDSSPTLLRSSSQFQDAEMIDPLTTLELTGTSLSGQHIQMGNPFQSAKNRHERMLDRGNQRPSLHPAPGSWRRGEPIDTCSTSQVSQASLERLDRENETASEATKSASYNNSEILRMGAPSTAAQDVPAWPKLEQSHVAQSYGLKRLDGTYTMLIRADELQACDHHKYPASQSAEGLIILPDLRLDSSSLRKGAEDLPGYQTEQRQPMSPFLYTHQMPKDDTQEKIDAIIAAASSTSPPRRVKVYCDKWVHDGVCAFTQVGCRYKHEMPMDRATQLSLGLTHGLPNWYKRQLGPGFHQQPAMNLPARTEGPNWRSGNFNPPLPVHGSGPGSFGPIAPPIHLTKTAQHSTSNTTEDGSDPEQLVFIGRARR